LFFLLLRHQAGRFNHWLARLYAYPLGLTLIVIPFIMETLILKPASYETYAMTWHGFVLGLLAFFFGFTFIQNGEAFWNTVKKWGWFYLGAALAMFLVRWQVFDLKPPLWYTPVESTLWILSLFGLGYRYLNRPSRSLTYLSQGAYPIYIIHMVVLYLGSFLIFPMGIGTGMEFILLILFTGMVCFLFYEFLIRRIGILRPLFGLKPIRQEKQ
jgi:hypothetical protein